MATTTNHGAVLRTAVLAYCTTQDRAALQTVYGAIPPAARGNAMLAALPAAGANTADVLDIFNSLPTAASTRVAAPKLTDDDIAVIRRTAADVIRSAVQTMVDAAADDLHRTAYRHLGDRLVDATATLSVSTGKTAQPGLADLVTAGRIPAGSTLTHGDHRCTVNADGTVTYRGQSVSPSKAARDASGGSQQNGNQYWQYNGKSLVTYRQ